jgi:hypothetical protein
VRPIRAPRFVTGVRHTGLAQREDFEHLEVCERADVDEAGIVLETHTGEPRE